MTQPLVSVVMGSDSDWGVMEAAATALREFDVPFEVDIVSAHGTRHTAHGTPHTAHRTPGRMVQFGSEAAGRGIRVIIAGTGGAAHLPGMLASVTTLPVIGVPVPLAKLDGLDTHPVRRHRLETNAVSPTRQPASVTSSCSSNQRFASTPDPCDQPVTVPTLVSTR